MFITRDAVLTKKAPRSKVLLEYRSRTGVSRRSRFHTARKSSPIGSSIVAPLGTFNQAHTMGAQQVILLRGN